MNNKRNILVTGANGQLGMEIRMLEKKYPQFDFIFAGREELSVDNNDLLEHFFSQNNFTHCINCAAYTAVDKAETEKDLAFEINAFAAENLAAICKKYNTQFIHISTDYVFDGKSEKPYKEDDQTNPINVYGASKLKGEEEIIKCNKESVIIRTSWVYSSYGKNFVKTMIRLMNEKERIGVVNDQFGCPTYAADLASLILEIISTGKITPGIYHYCNEGIISWYDFARAIKKIINSRCIVNPIESIQYPTPAERPKYSVLDTNKIQQTFSITIPGWEDSLNTCLKMLVSQPLP